MDVSDTWPRDDGGIKLFISTIKSKRGDKVVNGGVSFRVIGDILNAHTIVFLFQHGLA